MQSIPYILYVCAGKEKMQDFSKKVVLKFVWLENCAYLCSEQKEIRKHENEQNKMDSDFCSAYRHCDFRNVLPAG